MSTQGIDFSRLTLKDALDLAILVEEEAKERYDEFAEQMDVHDTPDAAAFFRFMSKNEQKHGDELSARRAQLFADSPRGVSRTMLFDVEAPDYDEARAFMTPRGAMQAALRCEEKAHAFFVAALPRIEDPDVRALFEELREEEVHHQNLVNAELTRLPPDPAVSAEDFVDEPNAQ
jgi:erythrin-vacuolar iron transport family protein